MTTTKQHSAILVPVVEVSTPATVERPHGNLQRWRERSAERKRRRLVSARHCRALAHELRRTATPTRPPSRFDIAPVLRDRVAAARDELLDVATALERGHVLTRVASHSYTSCLETAPARFTTQASSPPTCTPHLGARTPGSAVRPPA